MKPAWKLELAEARLMIEAAIRVSEAEGARETICVADDGGCVIALARMDGARRTGPELAIAKAFTASGHKRSTHLLGEPGGPAAAGGEAFGIHAMFPGRFAIFVGGFPIVVNGEVVGGIGVSGGTGDQDKAAGLAALNALQEGLGPSYRVLTELDIRL
ncbi:GlcG/HbpS family heme-binding protein [Cohnella nanjingensis]|uniref:Heme-binding protein n=1 Tax=Cohnella nanjingensis TaxID=1387779 RepID=A0A7X0S0C2_9BACL|nr:heme-binding protein [Cohnella nanjingensis]MBB6675334.1 heme-binding protein [Cohnella nanjingensis]